ncbi:MAG: long-chain fatty acid--CoA ligase [Syntrophaceae bacterium]|nr:long-chain fatty acid--CoA ligase [Syntrophaceae bacterium]
MDLSRVLFFSANKFPKRTAIISEGRRLTYEEFNGRVNRLAHALLRLGLKKGEKLAVLLHNSAELTEILFATVRIGGVFTPVNFRFVGEEVLYILNHSDARFFIYGQEFSDLVETIRSELKGVEVFISVGDSTAPSVLNYENLIEGSIASEPDITISEEDECELMYTSGTTGRPKGALLTHGNILWNLVNTILGREEKVGEVSLVVGPLYHTAALNNHFITRVALAGTSILIKDFDPEKVLRMIEKEKVSVISGAPAMYHLLLASPFEEYDRSSITKCTTGASILPDETRERLMKLFPNIQGVYDVYGCTEASPSIAILNAKDSLRKKECVGPPVPFLEVRVVDDQDRDVPTGEVGELVCRGPNVMKGYYKDRESTEETLRGGWLHTGDLGRMDEEGYVYIVDRKKDMIVSGGENIYPREIEELLYHHPKIRDVAVIGIPDPLWGESVKACVVLKPGERMKEEEVIEYCKRHLASYKKPKSVEFVDSLPRNPSGKVLKTVLRNRHLNRKGE